jgi:hypothetical protein
MQRGIVPKKRSEKSLLVPNEGLRGGKRGAGVLFISRFRHKNVPLGRSLAIYQTVSLGSSVNKGDGVTLPTSDLDVRQLLPQRKEYGPASIPIRARVA